MEGSVYLLQSGRAVNAAERHRGTNGGRRPVATSAVRIGSHKFSSIRQQPSKAISNNRVGKRGNNRAAAVAAAVARRTEQVRCCHSPRTRLLADEPRAATRTYTHAALISARALLSAARISPLFLLPSSPPVLATAQLLRAKNSGYEDPHKI